MQKCFVLCNFRAVWLCRFLTLFRLYVNEGFSTLSWYVRCGVFTPRRAMGEPSPPPLPLLKVALAKKIVAIRGFPEYSRPRLRCPCPSMFYLEEETINF
jgi:hypothetical protein